jgi:hypothetical protein
MLTHTVIALLRKGFFLIAADTALLLPKNENREKVKGPFRQGLSLTEF